jgi:Predicted thioesterase
VPFSCDRQVFLADTDSAGVVYFASLLRLCHEVYELSLAEFGINLRQFCQSASLAIPITHAEIDFFQPIYAGDKLAISLSGQKLTSATFQLKYAICQHGGQLASRALTKHTCICPQTRHKIALPDQIDRWLLTVLSADGSC